MTDPDGHIQPRRLREGTLGGSVQTELERLILTGALKPGERLNENQLSARFGTSRGPLREATRSLQASGLVEVVRNRGVFVRDIPTDEALEMYDIRAAVFGLAGRLLCDRVNDAMLARLSDDLERMDEAAARRDFDTYYPLNLRFHDYLVTSAGSRTLIREYKGYVNRLHLCRAKGLVQTDGMAISNREHRELVDCLATGNRERTQEAFFRHVERAKHRFKSAIGG